MSNHEPSKQRDESHHIASSDANPPYWKRLATAGASVLIRESSRDKAEARYNRQNPNHQHPTSYFDVCRGHLQSITTPRIGISSACESDSRFVITILSRKPQVKPHERFPVNLVLSCEQVRRLDVDAIRELQIPSLLLMENAARGAAEIILHEGSWETVTIICGPGNNGGDGLALARLLAAENVPSAVFLVRGDKALSIDAAANLQLLHGCGLPALEVELPQLRDHLLKLSNRVLVVDALLGTGIRGTVRSPFREVIEVINESDATVLSLDVPSGLDCDSGTPCGTAVHADRTVTFAAMKTGLLAESAAQFTGKLSVCHIGLPTVWLQAWHERLQPGNR